MESVDLAFAGIARQAELVRSREVSPRELVELYLERIARIDPRINAYRAVYAERALAEADEAARLDGGEERPLLGVPIAIKDEVDVAGDVTAKGTGAYGAPAGADCEAVRRLRAAGAIPIGKTHMPEMGIWGFTESATWGVTRNPWDLDRTPGGSSGGSAATTAAGLAAGALGGDGAGSIRIPAACCGLFGLKVQRGRVSLAPLREHWFGLVVLGCLTRTVVDSALFYDAVMGPAPGDADTPPPPSRTFTAAAQTPPGKLRIALSLKPPAPVPVDAEVRGAVEQTAELLRSLGHEVRERDPDYGFLLPDFLPIYARSVHEDVRAMARPERLERRTRAMGRVGGLVPQSLVARAKAAETKVAARINGIFDEHDVLLTAVTARPPVEVGRWEGRGAIATLLANGRVYPFTGPWNMTGQPAAAVPAGFTADGLPLSVQLVGRPNDEVTLISLAAQLEAARPWVGSRPAVAVE